MAGLGRCILSTKCPEPVKTRQCEQLGFHTIHQHGQDGVVDVELPVGRKACASPDMIVLNCSRALLDFSVTSLRDMPVLDNITPMGRVWRAVEGGAPTPKLPSLGSSIIDGGF